MRGERERRARRAATTATLLLSGVVAWAVSGCGGAHTQATAATPCASEVQRGVLPVWARAGFSDRLPRVPHVLGTSGTITAILFTYPLRSPQQGSHYNKVLWVSRVPTDGSDLRITARHMTSKHPVGPPVARAVRGGPGPSQIDLPSPGCWRLDLRWSGHSDQLDLQYAAGSPTRTDSRG